MARQQLLPSCAASVSETRRLRKQKLMRHAWLKYVPTARSKRNRSVLRRAATLFQVDPPLPQRCSSCSKRRRLGWWDHSQQDTWHCRPCTDNWHLMVAEDPVCHTCRRRIPPRWSEWSAVLGDVAKGGWWGDDAWHCEACWHDWFQAEGGSSMGRLCSSCRNRRWLGWYGNESIWHCEGCWQTFFAKRASGVPSYMAAAVDGEHYDFIEVGTSNYSTFTQACAGHPLGKAMANYYLPHDRDICQMRGLAVDMKRRYLDQLPDLPNVVKANVAIAESDGRRVMHHVPSSLLSRWEAIFAARGSSRAYDVLRLAHGCSALSKHRVLRRQLRSVGFEHLVRRRTVTAWSLATLFRRYRVATVCALALDCEGHDAVILRGFLRHCRVRPEWYPRWIIFETNGMNDEVFGKGTEESLINSLLECGYELIYGGGFERTGRRDTVLHREPVVEE
eukprot:TRINITY_DN28770_c0_g1_i1.p1 TRINITY_DN28770_c0_g1~~TRINITY_DN28770_c0_g1_i1.p1  ORF type:complete len:447 (-),score=59.44 TRINITY_DN28770_c0_g1_i1:35-1375(-)